MTRYPGCSPLLLAFVVACVLLFTAFHSSGGKSIVDWQSSSFISKDDLAARLKISERLWSASIKGRERMLHWYQNEDKIKNRQFPKGYLAPYNLYDFVYPAFNCPYELERVGRVGDGGKWVCGMTRYESNKERPCVIYSFGVNDDSAFENSMLSRTNCEIWGYDFSVAGWASQMDKSYASRAHFTKAGIGNVTDTVRSPPFYTVKDLMRMNGHDYLDIMKMDIEGSEFDALGAFFGEYSKAGQELPVGQLLLEVHMRGAGPHDPFSLPKSLTEWLAFWEAIEAKGLREVSVEPNLLGDTVYGIPVFAEVTMINVADKRSILLHG